MRNLDRDELARVSGGSGEPTDPPPGTGGEDTKNNNGYGNGAEEGPPPGHSGEHNPGLTGPNEGPLGPR